MDPRASGDRTQHTVSSSATIVLERCPSSSNDISPKVSPGPNEASRIEPSPRFKLHAHPARFHEVQAIGAISFGEHPVPFDEMLACCNAFELGEHVCVEAAK